MAEKEAQPSPFQLPGRGDSQRPPDYQADRQDAFLSFAFLSPRLSRYGQPCDPRQIERKSLRTQNVGFS
jgi:hypothetical protein